jgi:hypothetical protein
MRHGPIVEVAGARLRGARQHEAIANEMTGTRADLSQRSLMSL